MRRGPDRERQLRHLLEQDGWVVARSAGSRGCIDLLAVRGLVVYAIQVKSDRDSPWHNFSPRDRAALICEADKAGGQPWLVWWPPDRKGPRWISSSQWPKDRKAAA